MVCKELTAVPPQLLINPPSLSWPNAESSSRASRHSSDLDYDFSHRDDRAQSSQRNICVLVGVAHERRWLARASEAERTTTVQLS
jgi:hypothetical protein